MLRILHISFWKSHFPTLNLYLDHIVFHQNSLLTRETYGQTLEPYKTLTDFNTIPLFPSILRAFIFWGDQFSQSIQ